jgi:hypothetical protein
MAVSTSFHGNRMTRLSALLLAVALGACTPAEDHSLPAAVPAPPPRFGASYGWSGAYDAGAATGKEGYAHFFSRRDEQAALPSVGADQANREEALQKIVESVLRWHAEGSPSR